MSPLRVDQNMKRIRNIFSRGIWNWCKTEWSLVRGGWMYISFPASYIHMHIRVHNSLGTISIIVIYTTVSQLCLSSCLFVCLSVGPFSWLFVYQSIYLSIHMDVHVSVCPSTRMWMCLFVCLTVHLFVFTFIPEGLVKGAVGYAPV